MRRALFFLIVLVLFARPAWSATYTELFDLRANSDLRNKVVVAIAIAAQAVFEESAPTATRLAWAQTAIGSPGSDADAALFYILADNASATPSQITSATDATIQTAVNAWRDKIYP